MYTTYLNFKKSLFVKSLRSRSGLTIREMRCAYVKVILSCLLTYFFPLGKSINQLSRGLNWAELRDTITLTQLTKTSL